MRSRARRGRQRVCGAEWPQDSGDRAALRSDSSGALWNSKAQRDTGVQGGGSFSSWRGGASSRAEGSSEGELDMMVNRWQCRWLLAASTLLATLAPSLAGEWCENFESDAGTFWSQRSFSGQWQHTTYAEESQSDRAKMPKPVTGEEGMLMLSPSLGAETVASHLVSPELVFSDGASIELTYWLWYNGGHSQVEFSLYRLVNGVEDREPFLNISAYSSKHDSHWSTLEASINLDKGKKIRVSIYGRLTGNPTASLALDRVILRGVNDDKECEETGGILPTAEPGPEGPHFDFFCPTEYGLYSDPESCNYYYSCNDWLAIHMPCYTGLAFNAKTDMCDYAWNVYGCS